LKLKFVCALPNGKEFSACPKGTIEEKKYYFEHSNDFIGEMLTVQYNNLTEDGIPQFPIGLGFRLKEDLPMKDGGN
jgi:DNA ligase-1